MKKTFSLIFALSFLVGAAFLTSCHQTDSSMMSKAGTSMGETKAFGSDSIRSWVITDDNSNPSSMGVTFKESAFISLESDSDMMTMMMLPTMMSGGMMTMMAMPFDHVEVDWVPKGDPAPSPYDHAHLDCHFVTMSMMDQMNMMGGMDTTKMDMKFIPHGYMMDSMSEEGMGTHCMDTSAKEFHGQPFDHAFVYGFYHGNMAFMETMCAKSFLDGKTSSTIDVKQPQAFMKSGYYPLKYSVKYDAVRKEYSISLDNLRSH
jgi:hypothetical protein